MNLSVLWRIYYLLFSLCIIDAVVASVAYMMRANRFFIVIALSERLDVGQPL